MLHTVCAGVVGTSVIGTAAASSIEDEYGSVVDVTEEGADNGGDESVSPVLQDVVDDDTLLKFPPGRYYMDEQVRFTGFENVGLVGDDATLVPADYHSFDGPQYRLFRLGTLDNPGRDLHVAHFDVDQRASDTGIRAFHASVVDGVTVQNVDVVGHHDSGTWGPLLVRITDPGGSGRVEGVRMPDGAAWETDAPGDLWRGPTGILVNRNDGHLRFENCVVNGFPDNGLYCSGTGTIDVVGGRYVDNGPVSVRVGADRTRIVGSEFAVDSNPPEYRAQTPIRLDYARRADVRDVDVRLAEPNGDAVEIEAGVETTWMEDASIAIAEGPASGVVVEPGAGSAYLVDVDVDIEASTNAIRILGDDEGEVVVQGGRIAGGASGANMRHAIRCERDNCEFRVLTMDQWGHDWRRGLALMGRDYTVYRCEFRTNDRPVTAHGDDVWIQDCYLDAYNGSESLLIGDGAHSVRVKDNELPDGIEDEGGTDVHVTGTTD